MATTQVLKRFIQKLKKPSPKGPQFGKVFHTFLPLTSRGSHLPHDEAVLQVQGDHGGLTLHFGDFTWEFRQFAHLPCHLCPIFTCPNRIWRADKQNISVNKT